MSIAASEETAVKQGNGIHRKAAALDKILLELIRINPTKRVWYVTPWGDVHPRMPTKDYMGYEEARRFWVWYLLPIKPEYE